MLQRNPYLIERMIAAKKKHRIDTEKFQAYWFDEETIFINYVEDAALELSDIIESLEFQKEQKVQPHHKRICYADNYVTITAEARSYLEMNDIPVKAEAFILHSLSQKILFKLFLRFKNTPHPTKAFAKLDQAVEWLNEQ